MKFSFVGSDPWKSHYFRYFTIFAECTRASELSIDLAPTNTTYCAFTSTNGLCGTPEKVTYQNFSSYKVPNDCKVSSLKGCNVADLCDIRYH